MFSQAIAQTILYSYQADSVIDNTQDQLAAINSKQRLLFKSLITAYNVLLEDFKRISKAIDLAVDLTEFTSKSDHITLPGLLHGETSSRLMVKVHNGVEVSNLFVYCKVYICLCMIGKH